MRLHLKILHFVLSVSFWHFFHRGVGQELPSFLLFGGGFEAVRYSGDLTSGKASWERFSAVFKLSFQLENYKLLSPYLQFGIGAFTAQSPEQAGKGPNNYVYTKFQYISVGPKIRLLRWKRIYPYVIPNLGILFFDPLDQNLNSLVNQQQTRAPGEEYNTSAFLFPLLLGVHFRLHEHLHLSLQYQFYGVTTDYLDNIGELGAKAGNDHLSGICVTFYISPGIIKKQSRE